MPTRVRVVTFRRVVALLLILTGPAAFAQPPAAEKIPETVYALLDERAAEIQAMQEAAMKAPLKSSVLQAFGAKDTARIEEIGRLSLAQTLAFAAASKLAAPMDGTALSEEAKRGLERLQAVEAAQEQAAARAADLVALPASSPDTH